MPALQPQPQITSLEQYEALPENVRAEVFDGQIYYMASPSQIHQTILTELLVSIRNYLRKKGGDCQVFPAPFDVKLSDRPLNIVQPDLMVVCDKDKLDGKRCNGAPDFIIEIVSPGNPSDDYIRKLYHYQNAGVREYWIVDPRTEKVIVYHLEQPDFQMASYTFQDKIQANIWEDFWIDFQELGL
jgi:Uma2 family endonuclease|nr:Uma2 family endonuclease [uncultured Acetatifactor sp.]